MSRAFVVGEALIDVINSAGKVSTHVGGGPANTAKALARLGCESIFIGGISLDQYGKMIELELQQSGVVLTYVHKSTLPTAFARAVIEKSGVAQYEFDLNNTATFSFDSSWLPISKIDAIHVGSLATLVEPGASALLEWARESDSCLIFDPNVRPSVESDPNIYRKSVEKWILVSDVVKLSEDDLSWLYSDAEIDIIDKWLKSGVSLVIVTLGDAGLRAYSENLIMNVPGATISLEDTVGAGDTVGAVLVEGILNNGLPGLLAEEVLRSVLQRAVMAAGITCSRAGANPPWAVELD